MRKMIMTGLAMALTVGGAGLAAAQSTVPAQRPATAHARGVRGERGERGEYGRKAMKGMRKQLLKGITLSDAQKAQLKAQAQDFRAKNADAIKAHRETMKADVQALRTARQNKDSAGIAAARARLQADAKANAAVREQRLAAFRAVLTPAQQSQFDRNLAELKERREAREGQGKGMHKGWRKGDGA